jgi:tRNA 2-thiocytidine biosynthesis protein TtcA
MDERMPTATAPAEKRTRLFLHLKKWLEKAVTDYTMIAAGDRVLVGVSGGLDSRVLLDLLNTPMVYTPPFAILAVNIDAGFDPGYESYDRLERTLLNDGYDYVMEKSDIGPLAHSEVNRKNPCFLCSRLRRRRLFEIAAAQGCTKIALAHHRDDIIETLLINLFYGREISTMVPKQTIFGGTMHIIRPLAYIPEALVKKYACERGFTAIENRCPTSRTSRRRFVKDLLTQLESENPRVRENLWRAMGHVKPDYLPEVIATL